jgi:hypothetical protein
MEICEWTVTRDREEAIMACSSIHLKKLQRTMINMLTARALAKIKNVIS